MTKKVFITTAIDYANDVIHVGHAYEKILADAYARYKRLEIGAENVHFTTGTDEHGTTNEKAAEKRGLTPIEHVTDISIKDKEQIDSLNISYDRFIRTTDDDHKKFASEFYLKSFENGDIYKENYVGYYCEGCESPKTITELDENGQCPNHTTREIQKLEEENYFFKWSSYSDKLKQLIENDTLQVRPLGRKSEMLAFIENGLKDITISRPVEKVSWGIPVPNDESQVIYVWFDALINYLTEGLEKGFWNEETEIIHFVGKDISRWHALLWPAMLLSAGYPLPTKIYVHGFINLNGQKISKSLGNVIRPTELTNEFGVDAVRYYLLKHGPIVEDSNISLEALRETYNADLANGLGNTVARLAKLAENSGMEFELRRFVWAHQDAPQQAPLHQIEDFRLDLALQDIWAQLSDIDKHINENEPWAIKDDKNKLQEVLTYEINKLLEVAFLLQPFMPQTAEKILVQFKGPKIVSDKPLFPRLS